MYAINFGRRLEISSHMERKIRGKQLAIGLSRYGPCFLICLHLLLASFVFYRYIVRRIDNTDQIQIHRMPRKISYRCHNKRILPYTQFLERVLKSTTIYKQFDGKQYNMRSWPNYISRIFRAMLNEYLQHFNGSIVRIVEVGSFKGKSAIIMTRICRALVGKTKNCSLIAVDTWLGAGLYYEHNNNRALARNEFGASSLYEIFMNNIIYMNLTDAIVPLRLPSTDAARVLYCYNIKADLIYVDAGHDYESAYNDIQMYYKILEDGGYLFGDDFTLPGVFMAVNDFARKINTFVDQPERRTWIIRKSRKTGQ